MIINKSSKVVGGLYGVTKNKGPSERLMRIDHFLADLKQLLDLKIQREDDVKRVVAGLKLWFPKLWKKEQALVNVFDGTIASDETVRNVLSARKTGEDAMTEFFT